MIQRYRGTATSVITLFCVLMAMASTAPAVNLISQYKIPLKAKDRVLGSMSGNILVYGRPSITMYNQEGKAVFSRKLKNNIKPTLSPNGKHLGLVTYADRSPTDLKTVKFERYDESGKFLWKLPKPTPNTFMIADNGAIFGIEGVQGISPTRVYLYDPYGDLINILNFKDYHGILIAPGGGKFIIDRAANGLDVYDSLGNFLKGLPAANDYIFDQDVRYIGTFKNGTFRLYQDEKEVVAIRFPEPAIKGMDINVEQNRLVLMSQKRLEVHELTSKRRLWKYNLIEDTRFFTSLDLSDDARFIACGVDINGGKGIPKENRHVEGYMFVFPIDGKSLARQKETYSSWAAGLPQGVFSSADGSVMVRTREKLESFRVK